MLADILTDTLAPHSDMEIVGERATGVNLLDAATRSSADVVIVARHGAGEIDGYDELLYGSCHLKVIEISGEGRYGSLHELRPRSVPLGELSPPRLVEAIRAATVPVTGRHP